MISMKTIRDFCKRVVDEFRPQRIVLFGSYAVGNPTPDSDVDLLIILPFKEKPVSKAVEMRMKLRPPFPVDLIVRTPEKILERLNLGDFFLKDILETGKVLYEENHVRVAHQGRRRLRHARTRIKSA
jgi:uncharacterized protein